MCIAESVVKMIMAGAEASGLDRVLMVGGVAANGYVRREAAEAAGPAGIGAVFARRSQQ